MAFRLSGGAPAKDSTVGGPWRAGTPNNLGVGQLSLSIAPCLAINPAFPRVLSPFASHCTPSCFTLLDGVRLPEGLVSLCLPSYSFLFPFVRWCVRLPEILSPFACLPSCFPLLDGASAFPRSCRAVSHCLPSYFRLLNGVSAFPRVLSPIVSLFDPQQCAIKGSLCFLNRLGVGWRARLREVLSPLVSQGLSLASFFEALSSLVSLLFPFVAWCVRLSEGLLSLCLPLYPFLFPLDGVSAFPMVLSPLVSHCAPSGFPFVGWCVRLPEALSPLVSRLASVCWIMRPPSSPIVSPACFPLLDGASAYPAFLPPPCFPLLDGVPAFPRACLCLSPMLDGEALSPLVSPCLQQVVSGGPLLALYIYH